MRNHFVQIMLLPAILFSSCIPDETEFEKRVREDNEAIMAYLEENNEDAVKSPTGVFYKALVSDPFGAPVADSSIVSVIYTMKLLSGEVIEERTDQNNPVRFSYSEGRILPAGLIEIGRMSLGETYRFYIPSYLAFEKYSIDTLFPSYSNFIIDITIVDIMLKIVQDENEIFDIEHFLDDNGIEGIEKLPSGLYFKSLQEGGGEQPGQISVVKIHYKRSYLDGTVVNSTLTGDPLIVQLGNGNLIPGLEEGLRLMKEGGKAFMIVPSKIGFGESIQVIPQKVRDVWVESELLSPKTLPYSVLVHEVELIDVM